MKLSLEFHNARGIWETEERLIMSYEPNMHLTHGAPVTDGPGHRVLWVRHPAGGQYINRTVHPLAAFGISVPLKAIFYWYICFVHFFLGDGRCPLAAFGRQH